VCVAAGARASVDITELSSEGRAMTVITADSLARSYASYTESDDDESFLTNFSADFVDNVSGQRGLGIFQVVRRWLVESFGERRVEIHDAMQDGDRIMVWFTMRGVHIGNGFPRLAGRSVAGKPVTWAQVHIFRIADGLVVEHWAVRDDAALLDQIGPATE
jgi:predicted ester cyclase